MDKSTLPSLPQMVEIWQQTLNWEPNTQQQDNFQQLYELILQGNRQLNLTRITDPEEFWEKHLWDSLRGISSLLLSEKAKTSKYSQHLLSSSAKLIDIGTGAGFPGIPIGIVAENINVKLLDSTQKKINFIDTLLTNIQLSNIRTVVGRAEAIGQNPQHRENYDIATVRAVSNASVCAEYTLPLLKQGGLAVIYRGSWTEEETNTLESATQKLGGAIESIERFTTPLTQSVRHCLYLRKITKTPAKFPRAVGIPTQKPL